MIVRPLVAHEITTFASVCGRGVHASEVFDYLQHMLQQDVLRLEWCFVIEEANQIIGTIAYWARPTTGKPLYFELFALPWERDDFLSLGTHLLQETLLEMQRAYGVQEIGHALDTPPSDPQWQFFPEQRTALLHHIGFLDRRRTLRFAWQAEAGLPMAGEHLLFRSLSEVGEAAFTAAYQPGLTGDARPAHSEGAGTARP